MLKQCRLLSAALVIAALVAGTALFERSLGSAQALAAIDGEDHVDLSLLGTAYGRVTRVYYEPVRAQQLLDGERQGLEAELALLACERQSSKDERAALVDCLRQGGETGVAHLTPAATLPPTLAATDRNGNVAVLEREARLALRRARHLARGTVNPVEVTQAGVRGMLAVLRDPYTVYLTPHEITTLEETLSGGDFGGIGVYIGERSASKSIVLEPIEGTPAAKAGIKPGDIILSVDGASVRTMKLDDVEHAIRGKIGTIVVLGVRSHGVERAVSIVRDRIYVPSVHAQRVGPYQYVRLADFGENSYDEVRRAMLDGKAHHAQGYILDLRDNGGGLLEAAVQISSLFIHQGTIVTQVERDGARTSEPATQRFIDAGPLVVLVNNYSASASEITAGAIQDYHVGTILGMRSFGKGVVQSIYDTDDGGALKITTARYLTPSGRSINHHGIDPDIVVAQPPDDVAVIGTVKDRQLAAAKNLLERLARR